MSEAICAFPGVKHANVYGVAIPATEGRAGMAAVVAGDADEAPWIHACSIGSWNDDPAPRILPPPPPPEPPLPPLSLPQPASASAAAASVAPAIVVVRVSLTRGSSRKTSRRGTLPGGLEADARKPTCRAGRAMINKG